MPRHTNTRKLQKRRTPMKQKRQNHKRNQSMPKRARTKKMMMNESEMVQMMQMHEGMMDWMDRR